jgi:hypothetical protein
MYFNKKPLFRKSTDHFFYYSQENTKGLLEEFSSFSSVFDVVSSFRQLPHVLVIHLNMNSFAYK